MNHIDDLAQARVQLSATDVLLMGIAVRIQLPPGLFTLAQERFDTIARHLRRENNPIAPYVIDVYVQGSFSIGATVRQAKRSRAGDGFDIDGMVQIWLPAEWGPTFDAVGLLFDAINGERGSLYHGKVRRRARCVTIDYAELHFDLTPIVEFDHLPPRTGLIFESKRSGNELRGSVRRLLANPSGFADWYNTTVGAAGGFGQIFESASIDYDRRRLAASHETAAAVPNQLPAYRKPQPTIALQLFKRWRAVTWDRENIERRMPPSVLCAWFAASSTGHHASIREELRGLAAFANFALIAAENQKQSLDVPNPRCIDDKLTDRWPSDGVDQRLFIKHLQAFIEDLDTLGTASLGDQLAILSRLFGEAPAGDVIAQIREDRQMANAQAGPLTRPSRAGIPIGLGAATVAPAGVRAAPSHTNFGDPE